MSYILEALKKADQERDIGSVPGLESDHEPKRRVKWQYRWIGVMAVLLGLNVVFIALLTSYNSKVDDSPVTGQTGVETPNAANGLASSVPDPLSYDRRAVVTEIPRAEPQADDRLAVVRDTPRTGLAPQGAKRLPPAGPGVTRAPPPPAAKPVVTPAVSSPAPVRAGAETIPFLVEMPLEFRSSFPVTKLDVHVYDENASRRFILVDLKKYREGDELENGALLEEILPNGIQLEFRGERFRMRR